MKYMKVLWVITILVMLTMTGGKAQSKKHFHVLPVAEQQTVKLIVNASSVSCRINSTYNMHAVSVYGYPTNEHFNPVEVRQVNSTASTVKLNFEEQENFTSSISGRMFSRLSEETEKPWHVYLSRSVPFDLKLQYGMGNSTVDLSGLAVEKLKISTGSADIKVGYFASVPNKVSMDTFYAKVDMGTLELDQLNLALAQEVVAEVGFGRLLMHFTSQTEMKSHVRASVGAGSMEVLLDDPDIPVIVQITNSPLCRIKMLKEFKEISPNVYVNESYDENAENLIRFDIDVAMGNVTFRVK